MMDSMIGGINTQIDNSDVDTTGLDLAYNKADYTTDSIKEAEAALHQQIADEGTVLLSNEGILPMAQDTEFSFFSVNSATVSASDFMLGGRNLTQVFEDAGAMFPNAMTLAQTWNLDLASEYGTMIGNEGLLGGADGWYAPSMNIHRTPYSGRNGEYYSEDAFLSGAVASREVYGAASKGMYTYIKHFAFNDQENHRGDRDGQFSVATWFNEQSAREIYLVPFEMCMKVGDVTLNYVEKQEDGSYANASKSIRASQGVMTSFNRAGATWAGADVKLTSLPASARYNFDKSDPATYYYARQAMHRVLYTIANSKSMNGAMPGSQIKDGMRISDKIKLASDVIFGLLIVLEVYRIFRLFRPTKKKLAKLQAKAEKKAQKKQM